MYKETFYFYCFIALFGLVVIFHSSAYAAVSGYTPTATVTTGVSSVAIKNYMTKTGFSPSDPLAKVFPAIANGARIGTSSVGAAFSSVYAGSAAVVSKVFFAPLKGANLAIDLVSNIPKASLVSGALAIAKNPLFGVAVIAGTSLYSYYMDAGLSTISPGVLGAVGTVPISGANCTGNGSQPTPYAACTSINSNAKYVWISSVGGNGSIGFACYYDAALTQGAGSGKSCNAGYQNLCSSGNTWDSTYSNCNQTSLPPSPVTDADATTKLTNKSPYNPPGVLADLIAAGWTPDTDPPIATAPASTPVSTSVVTNPDSTTVTTDQKINTTCAGDTCTASEVTTTTNKTAAGAVTAVTTQTDAPSALSATGSPLATASPLDLTPVVNAINASSLQAHADALAAPEQIAQKTLNDSPLVMPTIPPFDPDTNQFFSFLNTVNPFSWDPSSWLPTLPGSGACVYEVHQSFSVPFLGNKTFNLAPCDKLAPLRVLLGWAFSVLTVWTVFTIIFRAQA